MEEPKVVLRVFKLNLRTTPRTEESAIQETEQEPTLQFQDIESLKGFLAIEFDQIQNLRR